MKRNDDMLRNHLSIAAGALRLLSFLLLAAAIVTTLVVGAFMLRGASYGGLLFVLDEMDDEIVAAFVLWGAFILSRYFAKALYGLANPSASRTGE